MPTTTGATNSASATLAMFLMRCSGKLAKIEDTSGEKETKMYMVDDAGHKVDQVYLCAERTCPGEFKVSDLTKRARMEGDTQVILTTEEIEDSTGSKLEKGLLDITAHPAEQVAASTWTGSAAYWFEPDPKNLSAYTLLCEMVANRSLAFCGVMNLRGKDKMYQLVPFEGGIVLQELLRPDSMHHFVASVAPVKEKERVMATALVEAATEDFDIAEYSNDRVATVRALIEAQTPGGTVTPIAKGKKAAPAEDATEKMLEAALAHAKARKAAKEAAA